MTSPKRSRYVDAEWGSNAALAQSIFDYYGKSVAFSRCHAYPRSATYRSVRKKSDIMQLACGSSELGSPMPCIELLLPVSTSEIGFGGLGSGIVGSESGCAGSSSESEGRNMCEGTYVWLMSKRESVESRKGFCRHMLMASMSGMYLFSD